MTAVQASSSIRLLLLEDNAGDAELELRELRQAGLHLTHRVVETKDGFVQAIREFGPDVILSDFSMPLFDGMSALRIARDLTPDTPFLFVSGTLGENHAIGALKEGATDYLLKNNLLRLPAAVERALAEAKERKERRRAQAGLGRAQAMAKLAHIITGAGGLFQSWSENLPSLIGVDVWGMPRSTREWLDLVHLDDREAFRQKSIEAGVTGKRVDLDYRMRGADGNWIHVRQVIEPLDAQTPHAGITEWFSTFQDTTEQKRAENKISRLSRLYQMLSGINSIIVRVRDRSELYREACRIAVDAGEFKLAWIGTVDDVAREIVVVASKGATADYIRAMPLKLDILTGEDKSLGARAVREKKPMIANDIENDPRVLLRKQALAHGLRSLVVLPLIVSGRVFGVLALYTGLPGFFDQEEMKSLLELAGDISFALEHIDKQDKLDYLAYFDPLTDLANTTLFRERVGQHIAIARKDQRNLAVLILDVCRFKSVNDALGRQAGDQFLKEIGQRLISAVQDSTRVARIGADHFAIVAHGVQTEEEVARLTEERLTECFGAPYHMGESELRLSARVGIAMFPNDGGDAESLLMNAEAALKKAKASGDRYLFYTQQMTARVAEKLALENKLRQALEREEFVLHYQPKVDLETRSIVGMEALIRWQSPELGLVPPMRFIPLLEETGLILEVGSWAITRASLDHRRWVEARLQAPRIAVNVSSIQLRQRDFVPIVERAIIEGIAPTGIDLEITESVVMEDVQGTIEKLTSVRGLGVRIAVDDFGTGYSSLAYLAKLPVHSLKIDRSFIITMLTDADTMSLVRTVIELAHSLKLKVVAEGVDSDEQENFLRLLRCDEIQGYLFSRPLPFEEITALLSPSV